VLLEKVRKQRREIRRNDEASQKRLLENLERKQLIFESRKMQRDMIIEKYRKNLSWSSGSPLHRKPKEKINLKGSLKAAIEVEKEQEAKDQIFGLTEVIPKPKVSLKSIKMDSVSPKQLGRDNSKRDFIDLSARYIVEKIAEAQKKQEKIRFKGIGLESTTYYKKYMQYQEQDKKQYSKLPHRYLKSMKGMKRTNEHVQSINRIREQMKKLTDKKNSSLIVVLESNLDNAFNKMDQDLNRVTAYAKYSLDFP